MKSAVIDLSLGHVRISETGDARDPGAEYGPPQGFDVLRAEIASWMGLPFDSIAITTGASLGLTATLATLDRPCSVLCPRPYYPVYPRLSELLGFNLIHYDLAEETGWQPDPKRLAQLVRPDTRAMLWNCPGNPVGTLPTAELLAALADFVHHHDLLLISDEVYADFVYDGAHLTDLTALLGPRSLVRIRSFSKLLGMPGERLGFFIAHPERVTAICRAQWTLALAPPATAQARALLSLRDGIDLRLQEQRTALARNRDRMLEIFKQCDRLRVARPASGIFLWIEVFESPVDSTALAKACRSEAQVAVEPGAVFGVDRPTYLRASFAVPPDEAERGAAALVRYISSLAYPPGIGAALRTGRHTLWPSSP